MGWHEGRHRGVLRVEGAVTAVTEYGKALTRVETAIPGLIYFELPVHGDARGWFKENWQREKMTALGLEDFGPVQNNVSFNDAIGTTRGIHAEPWDKWVSVATGRIFGAWVDLREGDTFGTTVTLEIDPSRAIFVPRGVGNSYQTLEENTAYTYLVNDHWSPTAEYSFLNLADETAAIAWPIPLAEVEISPKDLEHPRLADARAVPPRRTLVVGANGQLGLALREQFAGRTDVEFAGRAELDLTAPGIEGARRWRDYGVIINAAAHTAVDAAETAGGRRDSWAINVTATAALARIASAYGITLVHVSSDYVFDGTATAPYTEDAPVCPLGVYGQTKAAADAITSTVARHYVLRTSWVIGEGKNFVRTMASLAQRGVDPGVVSDQIGRLTFASDIAAAIAHLLSSNAPFGTYNVTGTGEAASWAEVAAEVYRLSGHDPARVRPVTTAEYYAGATGPIAPRPAYSVLSTAKLEGTGLTPAPWRESLAGYLDV